MLPLSVILTCAQANILIARVNYHSLPFPLQTALVKEIKSISPANCTWRK